MARTNLGRVVPLHKGDYSATIEYELNDIVSYNGSTYWHFTHEKTTGILPTETSVWKLVIDTADAEQYIARAETAALQAEGYADDAQRAKTDAETAKADAETAKQGAVSAKQDALASEENARSYMTAAQTAKGQAESARDLAIQAKTDTIDAKQGAESAKDIAVSAKNDAVSAKTAAETAKTAAQTASTHYPKISDANRHWLVWDALSAAYVDTGIIAEGKDGADGKDGKNGTNGTDGTDGTDGVSPTVATQAITGGTKVTITDKDGAHEFNVMNGTNGTNGKDGTDGTDGTDGITPTIGANGNWYIGSMDTGKPSRGAAGEKGEPGEPGETGPQGPKGDTGATGPTGPQGQKGDKGDTGAAGTDGITPTIGTNGNWYLGNTDTGKPSRGATGATGATGPAGKSAYASAQDGGFTGTEAQFNNGLSVMGNVSGIDTTVVQNSGNLITSGAVYTFAKAASSQETPLFAQSVDELNASGDKTKIYLLPDGYLYAWAESASQETVTVSTPINGSAENPYKDGYRLGSSGDTFHNDAPGYTVTPFIDLSPYTGKTIRLKLQGLEYFTAKFTQWVQNRAYGENNSVVASRTYSSLDEYSIWDGVVGASVDIVSSSESILTMPVPGLYGTASVKILGFRFCAKGSGAQSTITIEYDETQTVTKEQWTNTGVKYSDGDADTVAELNNEGADPSTIKLLSAPVLDFYNSAAYPDNDYTVTHLSKITYPCRADIPVPFTAKWSHNENAMRTTVAVDTKVIGTVNAYTMRTYDATGFDNYPIYNLLPNTTYYYKVTHVLSDGSLVEAKSGSFTTSSETWRLLYIDGTQNVRDLGGWTGLNGKKVKYGKIIRGAALSDSSGAITIVTGKGRLALGELKIQAELNLGAIDNATSIAANCAYKKIGYTNYAIAITGETYRAQFKEALEWIVACLDGTLNQSGLPQIERNIYMHCQGGCDRTGTLAFQLLGLLGVSESDLAKEYEISSFSDIGFGRLRNTVKATDTYDYSGMVAAIKQYDGATITDKFYTFATNATTASQAGCGISAATITSFRNLMLG